MLRKHRHPVWPVWPPDHAFRRRIPGCRVRDRTHQGPRGGNAAAAGAPTSYRARRRAPRPPQGVRGAAGVVAAHVPVQRADDQPVQLEEADQYLLHGQSSRDTAADQAAEKSFGSRVGSLAARGRARTTMSTPTGVRASRSAARCRKRRFTRLRRTAESDGLGDDETHPGRSESSSAESAQPAWTTTVGREARTPDRTVRRKSSALRIRAGAGNTVVAQLRRTACRDPCAAGRRGWRDRRGSASGAGSHGCGCGADCSAGRCACSREFSHILGSWQNSALGRRGRSR